MIVLKTRKGEDSGAFASVFETVRLLCVEFDPILVAIEGYSFSKNFSSGFSSTIEIGGAVKAAVGPYTAWYQFPPTTWKSFVMGSKWTRAGKQTAAEKSRYLARFREAGGPADCVQVDQADAWMIARAAQVVMTSGADKRFLDHRAEIVFRIAAAAACRARRDQLFQSAGIAGARGVAW